jgi:two-component system sensor histidine kinase VanS
MIWGRFYKVDESRNRENGGTGIGLALVKAIMNNYNNKYGVKNLENGVEFYCDINL